MTVHSALQFHSKSLQELSSSLLQKRIVIKILIASVAFVVMHLSPVGQYQQAKKIVATIKQKIHNID